MDLNKFTTNQLIAFVRLHTLDKYADQRIGTNPMTRKDLDSARRLIRARNRIAYKLDCQKRNHANT